MLDGPIMMNILRKLAVSLAAIVALSGLPATAQTSDASGMSAEELEQLFLTQKTRGLVLAPTGTEAATTEDGTSVTAETTPDAPVTGEAEVLPAASYVELDKSEQVNIQISFDFDSAALREDQKPKLATLCNVMQKIDIQLFRIVGHTDASGSAEYNQKLSQLRAEEVKRYMTTECGIASDRLEAVGVGKDFLFNKDDPRSDENRRVEFQALS
jgi:OOP family OmpA-OmpF porin